jgi:hypothetical protein
MAVAVLDTLDRFTDLPTRFDARHLNDGACVNTASSQLGKSLFFQSNYYVHSGG